MLDVADSNFTSLSCASAFPVASEVPSTVDDVANL